MVNKIFSAITTFVLALLLTQAAHALPQAYPYPTDNPSPPTTGFVRRARVNQVFDNPNRPMGSVTCSNGANGLATRFPTFGDVPSYPFIGGAFDIVRGSPNCGDCWNLTNPSTGVSILMTAIDNSGGGFTLTQRAFTTLTNGDTTTSAVGVVANKLSTFPCPSRF